MSVGCRVSRGVAMMLTGFLPIFLVPVHAAPPAVLMRSVCRSGGGWCCPLSPVAMEGDRGPGTAVR